MKTDKQRVENKELLEKTEEGLYEIEKRFVRQNNQTVNTVIKKENN